MGFKDGTNNLRGDDEAQMTRFVWVGDEEPQRWFRGGTYLVARRIRMRIEAWDRDVARRPGADDRPLQGRRARRSTGTHEHDVVDLDGAAAPTARR